MTKLVTGYYRHYKGGIAKVIDEAKHSETQEEYVAYYHKASKTEKVVLWIRPKKMFFETVVINGKRLPRFEYIGKEIGDIEQYLALRK